MSDLMYLPVEDRAVLAMSSLIDSLEDKEPSMGVLHDCAVAAAETWAIEGENVEEIAAALSVGFLLLLVRMEEDEQ